MSEKIIDEVMGLVVDCCTAYRRRHSSLQDGIDTEKSLLDLQSSEEAIRAKLREVLERKPLTDEQIEQATGAKIGQPLFLAAKGFVQATERAHGIGS